MATRDDATPEEAFAALGNEHRVAILRALAEADGAGHPTVTFSELYDRVDLRGTNQFAYHLDKLTGIFLERGEDGYSFTHAGDRVVRQILSGSYTRTPGLEPTTVEGFCPVCEARTLRVAFEDPLLEVTCTDCATPVVTYDLAPGLLESVSTAAVLRACDTRVHYEFGAALDGVCPDCGGETGVDVERPGDPLPDTYYAVTTCGTCERRVFAPLQYRLRYDPAVAAFYWSHGIDLRRVALYQFPEYLARWTQTTVSTNPLEVEFRLRHDGDSFTVRVDSQLDVTTTDASTGDT